MTKPIGRPTLYSEDLIARICQLVANGSNLNQIGMMEGYPTRETMYDWLSKYDSFSDMYVRARERRADSRSDRMDEYVTKMLAGELDHNSVRVALQAEQWQAAREAPRRYGDRITQEHTGADGASLVPTLNITVSSPPEK